MALVVLGFVGRDQLHGRIPVTLEVNGMTRVVQTAARTAPDLLNSLGYSPHPADLLALPSGDLVAGDRIIITRARPLLLEQGGVSTEVWVQAETVEAALAEGGIVVGPQDEIRLEGEVVTPDAALPAANWHLPATGLPAQLWDASAEPITISIDRAVSITLIDGDNAPAQIITRAHTLAAALAAEEVTLFEGDSVFPALDSPVLPGQRLVIRRSTPIEIALADAEIAVRTRRQTVGEALAEQGIVIMGMDAVTPPLSAALRPHTRIEITRVREDVVYEDELLPFDTVWEADENLAIDTRRVAQEGGPGRLRRRYRLRYENGEEVSRVLEDAWVAQEPQTKVIAYGAKITPQTLETPDGTITYWRKVRMYATSYSPARSGTPRSAPWYGRTRLGMTLRKGIVAVDPAVINMQQKMYVPAYGEAIAGDTGGGVVGKHIDLGYSDDDYVSWHWWTDVYLLWPPPPAYAINYLMPNWPRYPDPNR